MLLRKIYRWWQFGQPLAIPHFSPCCHCWYTIECPCQYIFHLLVLMAIMLRQLYPFPQATVWIYRCLAQWIRLKDRHRCSTATTLTRSSLFKAAMQRLACPRFFTIWTFHLSFSWWLQNLTGSACETVVCYSHCISESQCTERTLISSTVWHSEFD